MYSQQVWSSIDKAAQERANFINMCYRYWNAIYDTRCSDKHTNLAVSIKQDYPELEELSVDAIKELIEQQSEEYITEEAKTYIHI